jgi:hypothetical protein
MVVLFCLSFSLVVFGDSILDVEFPVTSVNGSDRTTAKIREFTYSAFNKMYPRLDYPNMFELPELFDRTAALFVTNVWNNSSYIRSSVDMVRVGYIDVVPEVDKNNMVFVPLQFIVDNLHTPGEVYFPEYVEFANSLSMEWDSTGSVVTVPGEFTHVAGTSVVTKPDGTVVDFGANSYFRDGQLMVCITLMSEVMNCDVDWRGNNYRVLDIRTPEFLSMDQSARSKYLDNTRSISVSPSSLIRPIFGDWVPPAPPATGATFSDEPLKGFSKWQMSGAARWYTDPDLKGAVAASIFRRYYAVGHGKISNDDIVKYLCRGDMYWLLDIYNLGWYNGYEIIPFGSSIIRNSDVMGSDVGIAEARVVVEGDMYVVFTTRYSISARENRYTYPIDVLYRQDDGRFYTDYNQDYIPYARRNSEQFQKVLDKYLSKMTMEKQQPILEYLEWSKNLY